MALAPSDLSTAQLYLPLLPSYASVNTLCEQSLLRVGVGAQTYWQGSR